MNPYGSDLYMKFAFLWVSHLWDHIQLITWRHKRTANNRIIYKCNCNSSVFFRVIKHGFCIHIRVYCRLHKLHFGHEGHDPVCIYLQCLNFYHGMVTLHSYQHCRHCRTPPKGLVMKCKVDCFCPICEHNLEWHFSQKVLCCFFHWRDCHHNLVCGAHRCDFDNRLEIADLSWNRTNCNALILVFHGTLQPFSFNLLAIRKIQSISKMSNLQNISCNLIIFVHARVE